MPIIQISLREGWSAEQKRAICKSIQKAIKVVFCIAHDNFHHRIVEYDASHMVLPSDATDKYILIELDMFPGRDEGDKHAVFEEIERNLLPYSIRPEDIMIIYREPPLENWRIGGRSAKDIHRTRRTEPPRQEERMPEKQWIIFFRHEAPTYLENSFTRNTVAEVDFIVAEFGLKRGQSVLDVGCGTGRHSLELARRGYRCTGIDQSAEMLEIGRTTARKEQLPVRFIQGEASTTRLEEQFDHAICLCEGAFSLLEPGACPVEYHMRILRSIRAMLKPGGKFLLTALNGLRMIREHNDQDVAAGVFDPMTTAVSEEYPGPDGTRVTVIEKGFLPSELKGLLEKAGFTVLSMWGGTAGSWKRQTLQLDEMEIMIVAGSEE